jgi:tetratricopeptide (TPR) repeat protein
VALVALKNNDLEVAADELKQAADLAPNNALVLYNLAVVQSKQGDAQAGLKNLQRALAIGLPKKEKEAAENLEADLTYAAKKQVPLSIFIGRWSTREETHEEIYGLPCFHNKIWMRRMTFSPQEDKEGELPVTYELEYDWSMGVAPKTEWTGQLDSCVRLYGQSADGQFYRSTRTVSKRPGLLRRKGNDFELEIRNGACQGPNCASQNLDFTNGFIAKIRSISPTEIERITVENGKETTGLRFHRE